MKNNLKIVNKTEPLYSAIATHPGEVLKEEIEARGLVKTEVAAQLEILPGHLSELFKGKRNMSALLALKLEGLLGISAEFWLQLQNRYDLTIIKNSRAASKAKCLI
jgi:HTH-type transcriptional regulator/antitoxin HigA